MNTATRLGGFAVGLAVLFGAAYGVGQVAGPDIAAAEQPAHGDAGHGDAGHDESASEPAHLPGGLQVSQAGYTFVPVAAPDGEFAFEITGPDGQPVTGFDVAHDKRMHLIAARRDLSGFSHVHPEMDAEGTWRVDSPLREPGSWRLFADFAPTGGEPLTLGVDVHVPGEFTPRPLPPPAETATVDGYTVEVDGALEPGRTSELTLTVSRDGVPVTDLQPYLGAYGHLVALRDGDLAYLHVHPDEAGASPGPAITFFAEVPSAGAYRLFLDFQHGGEVRTAEFTMVAGDGSMPVPAPTTAAPGHGEPGHGHD
jgi:hypothetical protein